MELYLALVCGGSAIACVLAECKAQHSGSRSNSSTEVALSSCANNTGVQCTVYRGEIMEFLMLPVFTLQGFPLYKVQQIGRATTGEPTLLKYRWFGEQPKCLFSNCFCCCKFDLLGQKLHFCHTFHYYICRNQAQKYIY